MSQSSPLKAAIDQAWELLMAYGDANKAAEDMGKEVSRIKTELKAQYDAATIAENKRYSNAADAATAARKALVDHQASIMKDYGVPFDLLGGQSGGQVRL